MSFITIFKALGKGLLIGEKIAVPIAEAAFPQFAPILGKIDTLFGATQAAIITAEQNNPADGQGGLKLTAVTNDFNAALAELQSILAVTGKQLTYDGNALNDAVAAQVAAYNAFAKVKASFKVADAPVAPTPVPQG